MAAIWVRIEMEFDGFLNGWTDVTDDVRQEEGIRGTRGLPGDLATDCVAKTGFLTFALDNSDQNEAELEGYYTIGHANARVGFEKNIGVRASIMIDGDAYAQFTGRLIRAKPTPGEAGSRLTRCTVSDYMDQCGRKSITTLSLQQDIEEHDVFQMIVDAMPLEPRALRVGTGFDTLPFVFDTMKDERATATSEFQRLCQSTLARVFVEGDGTFVYEPRQVRARNISTNVITVTQDDFPQGEFLDVDDEQETAINRVQANLHPRTPPGSEVVLYSLESVAALQPTTPLLIRGLYTEPGLRARRAGGLDMVPAEPTTDYTFNTEADGSGLDVTASATVETIFTANSVLFTVTVPVPCWVTKLQARGVGVFDNANTVVEALNQASIDEVGENSFSLNMPYTSDVALGNEVVQYLLFLAQQNTKRVRSVKFLLNGLDEDRASLLARREISDRIGFEEPMSALPVTSISGFNINAIAFEQDSEGRVWLSWELGASDATQYWILETPGRSELGFTTRLGFSLIIGHTDVAHDDTHGDVAHSDTAHNDLHGDVVHGDAAHADSTHSDVAHGDSAHSDVAHADAHSDTAHSDSAHADSHSDVAHQDSHGDVAHADSHTDIPHDDFHSDDHDDFTGGHPDEHQDSHSDFHVDSAHGDVAHTDGVHTDSHNDGLHSDTHNDVAHADTVHADSHGDISHTDIAHVDSHTDASHGDAAHDDSAHADSHTDEAHSDSAHADSHADVEHGDAN